MGGGARRSAREMILVRGEGVGSFGSVVESGEFETILASGTGDEGEGVGIGADGGSAKACAGRFEGNDGELVGAGVETESDKISGLQGEEEGVGLPFPEKAFVSGVERERKILRGGERGENEKVYEEQQSAADEGHDAPWERLNLRYSSAGERRQ